MTTDKFLLRFEPTTHKYYVKDREIPSVTGIISTILGNPFTLDTIYMRQARDKGTLIHNVINKFVTENIEPDFPMTEFENFVKLSNEHKLNWSYSEQIIYGNIDGMEYAGTFDLFDKSNEEISDIKTGSSKSIKKWQLQLSLYAQSLKSIYEEKVTKASILWLHGEIAEYIPIKLLSKQELSDFLMKYYKPDINNQNEEISLKCLSDKAIKEFNDTLTAIENMEQKIKSIKGQILSEMEQRQINQIKVGNRTISYIPSTIRESIDSKKLKDEYPQVWDMCKKTSKVSASIRIK